jgi:hypothetical protein
MTVWTPAPRSGVQPVWTVLGNVKGPKGDPGTPGTNTVVSGAHVHTQPDASTVWVIPHNLGFYPGGITVVDHTGAEHNPVVIYPDVNTVTLQFGYDVYGTAYLS